MYEELDRDLERELAGEEPTDAEDSENAVRDLPENFTDWVEENSKRIETSAKKGTLPYFLRDNFENTRAILNCEINESPKIAINPDMRIKIGGKDVPLARLIEESTLIETVRGKVYLHPNHGKNEKLENIEIAKFLSNRDEVILLLPKVEGVKEADSYNMTKNYKEEYKVNSTSTYNSIDRLLRDGAKQSRNILFRVDSNISLDTLSGAVNDRVKRSSIQRIRILRDSKIAEYTREAIIRDDFKIRQQDFL